MHCFPENTDFGTTIIEDGTVPLGVEALARIGVFVKMSSIKKRQAVLIAREMRWNPVQDDPDAHAVHVLDEIHEVLRRAIARGGGEVAGDLIAP